MTYRNKILLKRMLLIAGIVIVSIALVLLVGFSYLGRYVVYTEDGAHFSFRNSAGEDTGLSTYTPPDPPENPVLVTGESILEDDVLIDSGKKLVATEVRGLLLNYETLKDAVSFSSVELSADETNVLMLEMRKYGSDILNTKAIQSLISRAKNQEVYLVAMISCLPDSDYALEHAADALQIEGGALWVGDDRSYWLNPATENTQKYIATMIRQLMDMGFDEVVLEDFEFPTTDYISYSADASRDELLIEAFTNIQKQVGTEFPVSLYVSNPDVGHQAFDVAEHLYVNLPYGSELRAYMENHPDHFIVFLTDSHDTRYDNYGKIQLFDGSLETVEPNGQDTEGGDDGDVPEEGYVPPENDPFE